MTCYKILTDLVSWGLSQSAIADRIGCKRQNIHYLMGAPNAEPKLKISVPLKQLYATEKRKNKP